MRDTSHRTTSLTPWPDRQTRIQADIGGLVNWAIGQGYRYAQYERHVTDPILRARQRNQLQIAVMTALGCFIPEMDHLQIWVEHMPATPKGPTR